MDVGETVLIVVHGFYLPWMVDFNFYLSDSGRRQRRMSDRQ